MISKIKKFIIFLLDKKGLEIVRKLSVEKNRISNQIYLLSNYYAASGTKNISKLLGNTLMSESQLLQDLFVLDQFDFKKLGYFIEFGAADGRALSNTYILEKEFAWTGIVAEPSKGWHERLKINRNCIIDNRCVWSSTGENLEFSEVSINELSTVTRFENSDGQNRKKNKKYYVESISLNDLLEEYKAPKKIDYLSIDTEGSELEILQSFDFSKYEITVITVEHNYTDQREKIYTFLESKGYQRVFKELSKFDDWYILDIKN